MTRLRAAELEVLFTADAQDVSRAEKVIKTTGDRIEKKPITQKVDADAKGAVADMKKVEDAARRVVTAKTVAKVDADIAGAEKQFTRLYEKVDYLRAIQPEMQVDADITRAVKQMERSQARLDGLRGARAVMEVDADTQPLEDATDGVGKKAGEKVGGDIEGSLIAALTAIPIAGGIVLGAKAIGQALIGGIQEGMQIEVRQDRLQALTGITPEQARKFAFASGEAYANTFGESIESNMNLSRLGLQFGILDPTSTARDAQKVVEGSPALPTRSRKTSSRPPSPCPPCSRRASSNRRRRRSTSSPPVPARASTAATTSSTRSPSTRPSCASSDFPARSTSAC